MLDNIIKFDANYKTKIQGIKLSKKTIQTLNKTKTIFGLEKCYEDLKNYASFVKMKKQGILDFGSYNMLIVNKSEYKNTDELVEIIKDILKAEGIIKTSLKYINKDELEEKKDKKGKTKIIKEELIVIDSKVINSDIGYKRKEIVEFMKKNNEKIFLLIDNNTDRYRINGWVNAKFWDCFTWTITLEEVTKEEKTEYIKKFLMKSKIKVEERNAFIDKLSEEPFWNVLKEIKDIVLDCKLRKIDILNDENIKADFKKKYSIKDKKQKQKSGIKELNSLIGMDEVKKQVEQIINFLKINKERENLPALHMMFTGNPGTGKTTVARIIGKLFGEMKILSDKEVFVEVHGRDLVGRFVGWTAGQTKDKVKEAEGGVLFIDEAYSLNSHLRGSFEDEAIATLIKEMEDKRDKICIIMAGYENEMEELIKLNPGFESRIPFKIKFPDYSSEELYEIFKKMAKKENYKISNNIKDILLQRFEIEKKKENFANARCVRNIFEKVKFEQANRIAKCKEANINIIKKEDVLNVIEKLEDKPTEKVRIGFAM